MSYFVPDAFAPFEAQLAAWFAHAAAGSEHAEIEGRIGVFDAATRRFESHVDADWFQDKLQHFMAPGARWDRIDESTTKAFLFESGVRGVKKQDQTATFVRKVHKSHFDFALDGCRYGVRLTHALEVPMPPPCEKLVWVRLRRRKSFVRGCFRYDFSYIKEGATYQAASRQPLKYEIEIEYVPLQRAPKPDYGYLAMSLLFKMQDLVTPNGNNTSTQAKPLKLLNAPPQTH